MNNIEAIIFVILLHVINIIVISYLIHSDLMTIWRLIASIKEKMNEPKDDENIKK